VDCPHVYENESALHRHRAIPHFEADPEIRARG